MTTDRVTVQSLTGKKERKEKIVMVTATDFSWARIIDAAGADIVLVGDSLAQVALGHDTTLPVTVDEMLIFVKAVARGTRKALLVADMPFLSFQVSRSEAKRNAGRFLKEGMAAAVKLEGGREAAPTAAEIVSMGVPVMGHIGLTPQSVHAFGGYRVQGREPEKAQEILEGALALQEAGVFAVVLEGIPGSLAARITEALEVPTIGIGAGPSCDGQVLVLHDLLGLYRGFTPKFVKRYAELGDEAEKAVGEFCNEVRGGKFPDEKRSVR